MKITDIINFVKNFTLLYEEKKNDELLPFIHAYINFFKFILDDDRHAENVKKNIAKFSFQLKKITALQILTDAHKDILHQLNVFIDKEIKLEYDCAEDEKAEVRESIKSQLDNVVSNLTDAKRYVPQEMKTQLDTIRDLDDEKEELDEVQEFYQDACSHFGNKNFDEALILFEDLYNIFMFGEYDPEGFSEGKFDKNINDLLKWIIECIIFLKMEEEDYDGQKALNEDFLKYTANFIMQEQDDELLSYLSIYQKIIQEAFEHEDYAEVIKYFECFLNFVVDIKFLNSHASDLPSLKYFSSAINKQIINNNESDYVIKLVNNALLITEKYDKIIAKMPIEFQQAVRDVLLACKNTFYCYLQNGYYNLAEELYENNYSDALFYFKKSLMYSELFSDCNNTLLLNNRNHLISLCHQRIDQIKSLMDAIISLSTFPMGSFSRKRKLPEEDSPPAPENKKF